MDLEGRTENPGMSAATVMHDFRVEIEGLIAHGFPLVPIPRGTKKPVLGDWPELQIGQDNFRQYFPAVSNVGLRLDNLVDVDLDVPEALAVADSFLPPTRCLGQKRQSAKPSVVSSRREYPSPGFHPG
jgi:hypothetical protein